MTKPIQIIVGGTGPYDPAAGSNTCNIPTIKGQAMWVEKYLAGSLPYSTYNPLQSGGFSLVGGTFALGEIYFVHAVPLTVITTEDAYTNGFNLEAVMAVMFGRIGWQQGYEAGEFTLSDNNLTSRSGRYFNEAHAVLTVKNMQQVLGTGLTELQFNNTLETYQRSAIMRALTAVFSESEIIEQVKLYDRCATGSQTLTPGNNFIGWQVETSKDFKKAVQIESLLLQFTTDATFNVYIFQDGKVAPIFTQEVTVTGGDITKIDLESAVLKYISPNSTGNRFFIGYFEADLPDGCKSVQDSVSAWNKRLCFSAYPLSAPKVTGQVKFDIEAATNPSVPSGINMIMRSFSDWTETIRSQSAQFDHLIMLTMATVMIEKIIYTNQSNDTERSLKNGLQLSSLIADLQGSAPVTDGPPPIEGIRDRIKKEVKRVKSSLFPKQRSFIQSVCNA